MFKKIKNILFNNISTKQTIAKNTFWLFTAEGISKLLMFFITILIARYLGTERYGKFSFAFGVLFAVLADFGLSTLTIRRVVRNKDLAIRYVTNIALIKIILSFVTILLIVSVINLMNYSWDTTYSAIYILGLYVILTPFSQVFRSIFKAFEVMGYKSLVPILGKL